MMLFPAVDRGARDVGVTLRAAVAVAVGAFVGVAHAGVPSFTEIGAGLGVTALSADGSTAVGTGPAERGFIWTAGSLTDSVSLPFGPLPAGAISNSSGVALAGVSADGSVILGTSPVGEPTVEPFGPGVVGSYERQAFFGSPPAGLEGVPGTTSGSFISADGTTLVVDTATGLAQWERDAGLTPIVFAETGFFATRDMSADATRLVGIRRDPNNPPFQYALPGAGPRDGSVTINPSEAVIWDLVPSSDGTQRSAVATGLGSLPAEVYDYAEALAISDDGTTVVGWSFVGPTVGLSFSDTGFEAFRWTESTGMVALGDLVGAALGPDRRSRATAVSGDGSVVLGNAIGGAFIWTEPTGMLELAAYLATLGLGDDLAGWELSSVADVSADGTVIAGNGTNPQGQLASWIAVVPEPGVGVSLIAMSAIVASRRRRGHVV